MREAQVAVAGVNVAQSAHVRAIRETDAGTVDRPVCYAPRAIRRTRE